MLGRLVNRKATSRAAVIAFLPLVLLNGCQAGDPPEVTACEAYVLTKLGPEPGYARVQFSSYDFPRERPLFRAVGVKYAAKPKGRAAIEDTQWCRFPLNGGRADVSQAIDHDEVMRADTGVISTNTPGVAPAATPAPLGQ